MGFVVVEGLFYSEELVQMFETTEKSPQQGLISWIGSIIPGYKDLMASVGS